nr:protein-disulfide reductase DsbD [uncultured Ralstonia sp.]
MFHRKIIALVLAFFTMGAVFGTASGAASGTAWAASPFPWQSKSESDFLDAAEVFTLSAPQQKGDRLVAAGHVADGYYVYRKSLRLEDAQGKAVELTLSPGTRHTDEFFGDTDIYKGDALQLSIPAQTAGPVVLHWQGCAEAGICYPPQTMKIALPASTGTSAVATQVATPALAASAVGEDQAVSQRLASLGPVAGALLFFGFGLLLAFTPCTLPMIPIVSTMVVGSQAKPRRAFMLTLSYVLAMAATYAAVGVAAGLAGANLQAALQSPWLLGAFAGLFLVLAASLFGLFELRLPAALMDRLNASGQNRAGGSVLGAAALGLLSALLVGPCMTAPLAGALLYIGQTGSAVMGGVALFALGVGMGLPLLVIAVFGARVLPRPGPWMERVRVAFGYVMAGMAILMLSRFLPGNVSLMLWGALGLAVSVGLVGWIHAMTLQRRLSWLLAFGAVFVGLWSAMMLTGAAIGGESPMQPLQPLRTVGVANAGNSAGAVSHVRVKSVQDVDERIAQAGARGQWTLIDFYADWCVSCQVIEHKVFSDPAVSARLAKMQVLRPDVTRNDATDQALMKRWGVLGPPTLILVGPDGQEMRAQRMVGELDARSFMQRLDTAGVP